MTTLRLQTLLHSSLRQTASNTSSRPTATQPTGTHRCDDNTSSYTNRRSIQVETPLWILLLFGVRVRAYLKLPLQRCGLVGKCRVQSNVLGESVLMLCEALRMCLKTYASTGDFLTFLGDNGLETKSKQM
jgi:hypothetical protein